MPRILERLAARLRRTAAETPATASVESPTTRTPPVTPPPPRPRPAPRQFDAGSPILAAQLNAMEAYLDRLTGQPTHPPMHRLAQLPLVDHTIVIPAQAATTPRHDERHGRRLQPIGQPSPASGRHHRPEQPTGRHRAITDTGAHRAVTP